MKKLPTHCTECLHHLVAPDPDPDDWFCHDDVKVICVKISRNVTVACRPYSTRRETVRPDWCPIADPITQLAQLTDQA